MHRPRICSQLCRLALVLALLAGTACSRDDVITNPFDYSTTADHVAGEAADALGDDGKFRLPASVTEPSNEIPRSRAEVIAVNYARRWGRFHIGRWEDEIRRSINLNELVVCDRAFYARSAYELPGEMPQFMRRQLGNRWLVALCDAKQVPTVAISFSPEATDLTDDLLGAGSQAVPGAVFSSAGIPLRARGPVPLPPEFAVVEASKFSTRRVAQVPELIRPPYPHSDFLARWRVAYTEALPLFVRGSGSSSSPTLTNEVFFGFGDSFGPTGVLVALSAMPLPTVALTDPQGITWTLRPRDARKLEWASLGRDKPVSVSGNSPAAP